MAYRLRHRLDRYRWAAVTALAASCLATECYDSIGFRIRGDLGGGVTIEVISGSTEQVVTVESVSVGEVIGPVVWRLEGRASVKQLVYGEAPKGLNASVGPIPLKPDHAYYIKIFGRTGWRREAKGACRFYVDAQGRVQTERGC